LRNLVSKVVLLAGTAILLGSCSYENVEISGVKQIQLSEINGESLQITGEVKVNNPNSYPIKIRSIDADVFVNEKKAGKARLLENIRIPSNSNQFVKARIETKFEGGSLNMLPIILQSALSGKAEIRMVGDMKASSYLYGRKIAFDFTEKAEI